jgi:hypothetical protein
VGGTCGTNGEKRNVCRLLVRKPKGKRPLQRRWWMDNFKMDLIWIGRDGLDWIGLAQDRYRWRALVKAIMNLGFHKILGNCRVAAQLQVVLSSTESVS